MRAGQGPLSLLYMLGGGGLIVNGCMSDPSESYYCTNTNQMQSLLYP